MKMIGFFLWLLLCGFTITHADTLTNTIPTTTESKPQTAWEMLLSPQFLVGTIIAGVFVNIISHFLNPKISTWLAIFSKKWKERTEEAKAAREKRITHLINNPQEQQIQISLAIEMKISALMNLAVASFFLFGAIIYYASLSAAFHAKHSSFDMIKLAFAFILTAVVCFVFLLRSFNRFNESADILDDIKECKKRQSKQEN